MLERLLRPLAGNDTATAAVVAVVAAVIAAATAATVFVAKDDAIRSGDATITRIAGLHNSLPRTGVPPKVANVTKWQHAGTKLATSWQIVAKLLHCSNKLVTSCSVVGFASLEDWREFVGRPIFSGRRRDLEVS